MQHDMNIANGAGATVRSDLNNALEALATNNSGSSAPSTTFANMWWFDEANNILKQRSADNTSWINVASKSGTNWVPYRNGVLLGDAATLTKDTDGTLAANSDSNAPTQKAVKTYVDGSQKTNVGSFTYDVSLVTDLTVSGIGFTPKRVTFYANIDTTQSQSQGFADASGNGCMYYAFGDSSDVRRSDTTKCILIYTSPSAVAKASLASFNSDGFVLARSKSGAPTGTLTVNYMAEG